MNREVSQSVIAESQSVIADERVSDTWAQAAARTRSWLSLHLVV
jgi:hypothetical protein